MQKKESDEHIERKKTGSSYGILHKQVRVFFQRKKKKKKACGLPIDLEAIRTSVGLILARPAENCVGGRKGQERPRKA